MFNLIFYSFEFNSLSLTINVMYFLIHCCIYLNTIPPCLFKINLLLIFNLVDCFVFLLQTIVTLISFCITVL